MSSKLLLDVTKRGLPEKTVELAEMGAVYHSDGDAHGAILFLGNGTVQMFFNGSPVTGPQAVLRGSDIQLVVSGKPLITAQVIDYSPDGAMC